MSLNNDTTTHKTLLCGLLGKTLGHSFSPIIHSYLGDYGYRLFEKSEEELGEFLTNEDFHAINVTIPYKKAVIPYLSKMSDEAKRIGSVNTVIRLSDGSLFGDNTDYFGFSCLVRKSKIDIKGKKAIILGNGGASLTVKAVLCDMGAKSVTVISRSGEDNYANISRHYDADYIINTTPVGMYPNNAATPLSLDGFHSLVGVADLIYNPRITRLCYEAEERGIRAVSGISMLVAQAKAAAELFSGEQIPDARIEQIITALERDSENVILIGMPGCGKSKISAALGALLGREVIDTDAIVESRVGMRIADIFRDEGEAAFRDYEHEAVCEACSRSGVIIATGGGVPTFERNIRPMRQNGRIVYLERPTHELSRKGRPLSESADMDEMFRVRRPFYERVADITVSVRENPESSAHAVMMALYGGEKR